MKLPLHKTKIVCTIGPASEKPEVMEKMLRAGMNIAGSIFSHRQFRQPPGSVRNLRAAAHSSGDGYRSWVIFRPQDAYRHAGAGTGGTETRRSLHPDH